MVIRWLVGVCQATLACKIPMRPSPKQWTVCMPLGHHPGGDCCAPCTQLLDDGDCKWVYGAAQRWRQQSCKRVEWFQMQAWSFCFSFVFVWSASTNGGNIGTVGCFLHLWNKTANNLNVKSALQMQRKLGMMSHRLAYRLFKSDPGLI